MFRAHVPVLLVSVSITASFAFNCTSPYDERAWPPLYDGRNGDSNGTRDAGKDAQIRAPEPGSPGSDEYFNWWFLDGNYKKHPAFAKMTSAPYPSAVTAGSKIEVYITRPQEEVYGLIAPDRTSSKVTFPPRTIIVREVIDANGNLSKITVMSKALDGYNRDLGDWYFGEYDPTGKPLRDARGQPRTGKLVDCYGCHLPRANDAYLFGVPPEARAL